MLDALQVPRLYVPRCKGVVILNTRLGKGITSRIMFGCRTEYYIYIIYNTVAF
jgi:hypothetical protein